MSDKTDYDMPTGRTEEGGAMGKFRRHKDIKKDEFHVHHKKKPLRFCMKGIRRFELAASMFLNGIHNYKDGAVVVFPGEPGGRGEKAKACDLVYQRKGNDWKVGLFLCGEKVGDVVYGDPIITDLDEAVQRG